jgi:uncharacterized protein
MEHVVAERPLGCGSQMHNEIVERDMPFMMEGRPCAGAGRDICRLLNLGATPTQGLYLSAIDLDLTVDCNLRCSYCFKEKRNEHMEDQVAFDAMVWLLYASGPVKDLRVNLMGGEPMLRFHLIKRLVPFAKRRAWQTGKKIHFGVTTNCTLVTDEIVEFWRQWGMGFHSSIDGTPEIQDHNRPTAGGQGSSELVELAVPRILGYRPGTTARCTIVAERPGALVDNYRYFRSLGYVNIAFSPAAAGRWSRDALELFENQYSQLADLIIDEFRAGRTISVGAIDAAIESIVRNERYECACGAGRGTVLIDVRGDIWPCHRWNKQSEHAWRMGSIYDGFDDLVREKLDVPSQAALIKADCGSCVARVLCSGGCPAENLEDTGDPYRPHPNSCELIRTMARAGKRVHDALYGEQNALFLEKFYKPRDSSA